MLTLFKWVLGFGIKKIAIGFATVVVGAAIIWLWNDYLSSKEKVTELKLQIEQDNESYNKSIDAKNKLVSVLLNDLQTQRELTIRRTETATVLQSQLDGLKDKVRTNEQDNCGIHPAITYSIEQLREQSFNKDGGD